VSTETEPEVREPVAKHEASGDRRVWKHEYQKALDFIDTGNVVEARRLLKRLAKDAPFEQIREDAASKLKQFDIDWMAYAFMGGTLLVIIIIVARYYL
jgi:hypothetical protein